MKDVFHRPVSFTHWMMKEMLSLTGWTNISNTFKDHAFRSISLLNCDCVIKLWLSPMHLLKISCVFEVCLLELRTGCLKGYNPLYGHFTTIGAVCSWKLLWQLHPGNVQRMAKQDSSQEMHAWYTAVWSYWKQEHRIRQHSCRHSLRHSGKYAVAGEYPVEVRHQMFISRMSVLDKRSTGETV